MTTTRAATPAATPAVRGIAARHNVDLDTVHGTGAGGRIRTVDVLRAAAYAEDRVYRALFAGQHTTAVRTSPTSRTGGGGGGGSADDQLYRDLFGPDA